MAKFKNGFLKAFSGAVGGIEGYELNGQLIIRSRRSKPTKPPSPKQIDCREKMKMVSTLLGSVKEVVKMGFAGAAQGRLYNAYCAGIAYNLQHAVIGQYPDLQIDYAKLRITQGPIPMDGLKPTLSLDSERLTFTWMPESGNQSGTDRAILVAIVPVLQQAVYNLCGNLRSAGIDQLVLPDGWQDQEIHAYLSFRNEEGNSCENSVYCGNSKV